MIEIFEANPTHIATIQEIAYKTWPKTYGDILLPEQFDYMLEMMYSADALQKQFTDLGHHFLIAYHNNKYLGFISYESSYKGEQQTKIHKIYILPEAQGLGVGKRLMEAVEAISVNKGNKKLFLNVNKYNNAEKFYHRLGFKVVGTEDIDIGLGFLMEDKIMEKQL